MIKSRHTDEEKQQCVNEYLNGENKYYLAGKYSISIRTIDRWIKNSNIDELKLRMLKRAKTIPIKIQQEILKVLNSNPICVGFNISYWKEFMIIDYINDKYNITINRRMAKNLIEDSRKVNVVSYEEKVLNDIEELADLGYSIVLLDYLKIGKVMSQEIEGREHGKTVIEYIDDEKNRGRVYRGITDIDNTIRGKIDRYVLDVTNDKIEYEKGNENNYNKKINTKKNEENMRKYIKILKSEFINNI